MPLLYKPCSDRKPGGALCGGRDSRGPPVSHPLPQAGRQGQKKEDSRYAAFSQGSPDGSPGKSMDPGRTPSPISSIRFPLTSIVSLPPEGSGRIPSRLSHPRSAPDL